MSEKAVVCMVVFDLNIPDATTIITTTTIMTIMNDSDIFTYFGGGRTQQKLDMFVAYGLCWRVEVSNGKKKAPLV